jgi:ankyrin repeat protein
VLIHEYARQGNVLGVSDELSKGVDIDAIEGPHGLTPLMHAVISPEAGADMVHLLTARGANVNAIGSDGPRSVLSFAVGTGNLEKITAILDAGADIRYQRPYRYDVLIDAMHGRMIAQDPQLVPVIQLLINRGANLNTVSEYSESALSVASNNGRFDAVQVLLAAGADPSPLQWTPLMHAIALGSLGDVQVQLDRGGELTARDFWERTPWLLSLQVGDVLKAKLLLAAGADRDDRGRCGKSPLMYPIINGHVEMLRWLLSEGFDPNDVDEFQTTPLMEAVEYRALECVNILIAAGADIHRINHCGEQAITRANDIGIVRVLVDRGADLNDIADDMRAALTHLPIDGKLRVSREEYVATKYRSFGKTNPEKMNFAFWKSMVTSGATAWRSRESFNDIDMNDEPIWCFKRFGKSINELRDGRIIEIGGEHEDSYDPDFCIYNDVIVHYLDGTFDIYGYPKDVFPPTDFHTATLVEKYIYVIGSLGYNGERLFGETPVYRLNIDTIEIEKINTSGHKPGWISRHKAYYNGDNEIRISGGKVCVRTDGGEEYRDNSIEYVLNLEKFVWSRVNPLGS